jgi:hypothetical protein
LIAVKSLLDFYARLMARLIVPKATVFGFSKDTYKGRKIVGGRFLKWIESSTPSTFVHRQKLLAVLVASIDAWIQEAVGYRDAVVHEGGIPGLTEVMAALDMPPDDLQEDDLVMPMMPNGVAVTEYCELLVQRAGALIAETIVLLPDIDVTLVSIPQNIGDEHS